MANTAKTAKNAAKKTAKKTAKAAIQKDENQEKKLTEDQDLDNGNDAIVEKRPDPHPLDQRSFGLAKAKFRSFDAIVPDDLVLEDLENPKLWENIGRQLREGDEIRVRTMTHAFTALLYCTYASGAQVRMKLVYGAELEDVGERPVDETMYEVINLQHYGWCVRVRETGEIKVKNIPTQADAYRQMSDLMRALAA